MGRRGAEQEGRGGGGGEQQRRRTRPQKRERSKDGDVEDSMAVQWRGTSSEEAELTHPGDVHGSRVTRGHTPPLCQEASFSPGVPLKPSLALLASAPSFYCQGEERRGQRELTRHPGSKSITSSFTGARFSSCALV